MLGPDDVPRAGQAHQARSNHPLVLLLRRIRRQHRKALVDVETCMELPIGTLKQIEQGRRPLPQLISSDGQEFAVWYQSWLECVEPTEPEREEIEELLMAVVLGRLKGRLHP